LRVKEARKRVVTRTVNEVERVGKSKRRDQFRKQGKIGPSRSTRRGQAQPRKKNRLVMDGNSFAEEKKKKA